MTRKCIEILTFGDFDIRLNDKSVFNQSGRKHKNLELLKFFITNRNKKLVPENIIDFFWSDKDYEDPKNALSTQIHRLKKTLQNLALLNSDKNSEDGFELRFINGFYLFSTGQDCVVDADNFKEKVAKADSLQKIDPDEAIIIYKEILNIYKGQYLEDNLYSEWAINVRNKYHRMFVQSAIKLLELLKNKNCYEEIVILFEEISLIDPYEESFHLYLMEALLEMKEYRYALSHYNYLSTKMYKDIGVRPSSSIVEIYRKILRETDENEELDAYFIDKKLIEGEIVEGSLICEKDHFKFIYNLEKRRSCRYGKNSVLMICTLIKTDLSSQNQMEKAMKTLINLLWLSLRKSDLVCRWNHNQVLIFLNNVTKEHQLRVVSRRINRKFKESVDQKLFKINLSNREMAKN